MVIFDYSFYKDLIESLPVNIKAKVLCKMDKLRNIPGGCKIDFIDDPEDDGKIHDRFIATVDFGYLIGISLNGIHRNKTFIKEIFNLEDIKILF